MKNHSKVGNRRGKPAYRTSSAFLHKKTKKPARNASHSDAGGQKNLKTIDCQQIYVNQKIKKDF